MDDLWEQVTPEEPETRNYLSPKYFAEKLERVAERYITSKNSFFEAVEEMLTESYNFGKEEAQKELKKITSTQQSIMRQMNDAYEQLRICKRTALGLLTESEKKEIKFGDSRWSYAYQAVSEIRLRLDQYIAEDSEITQDCSKQILEIVRMQLAACGVAVHGGTAEDQRIEPDNPYWSDTYQATLELRENYDAILEPLRGYTKTNLEDFIWFLNSNQNISESDGLSHDLAVSLRRIINQIENRNFLTEESNQPSLNFGEPCEEPN